jgi:putative flippase GtrA
MSDPLRVKEWPGRFGRFLGVGAFATALQYALLIAGVELVGADAVSASTAGFAVSAIVNYLLNYHYTFRSNRRHRSAAMRFAAVAATGLVLNSVLMQGLTGVMGLHYVAAQVVTTATVLAWNFAAGALWSFARQPS